MSEYNIVQCSLIEILSAPRWRLPGGDSPVAVILTENQEDHGQLLYPDA